MSPSGGQGVFWSSSVGREYPVPVRIRSFEAEFKLLDPDGKRDAVKTFASSLRERSDTFTRKAEQLGKKAEPPRDEETPEAPDFELVPYAAATKEQIAINALKANDALIQKIKNEGERFGTIQSEISKAFKGMYAEPFKMSA